MQEIWHILWDTFLESLLILPFLFGAYLLIEYIEHRASDKVLHFLGRAPRLSVPVGALAGCVPQCGFSVASSNLYAGGIISAGTLLAVFLSTSDEALLVLLTSPQSWMVILKLMGIKVIIGIGAGYLFDALTRRWRVPVASVDNHLHDHHAPVEEHGILKPALTHTVNIYIFILIISFVLEVALHYIGEEQLSRILLSGTVFQPVITALVGLIPNCAASVLLAELYLAGGISFGSMAAGLCSAAGMGLVVLFRTNRNMKANFAILGYLYVIGVAAGMLLNALGIA